MIAELGIITSGLAFLAAVYALPVALIGARARYAKLVISARYAAMLTFPLLTVACLALVYGLLDHEYSIAYVYQTTDNTTPTFYLITGLWGSQAGSLLFWSWLLSAFTAGALWLNWQSERRLMPYVIAVTMATLGFFLYLNVFVENPFARYWIVPGEARPQEAVLRPAGAEVFLPSDGAGLNPLLRHIGMIIHPPLLYLGFVGFTIPFAFAFAALVTGQLGAGWIRATRTWALVAWLLLSLGLLLGGRWAYDVQGWGGYWGWDPVENAALLPWLTGTAFLHSAVVQEKRGMLKFWNLLLIILTFLLIVLGTFATRSGVVNSVHSFAESKIGRPMFAFLALSMVSCVLLLASRQERGDLRGADELDSLLSREALILLNNWLFLALTLVVLWGTWAEAITTIAVDLGLRDTVINLGPDYFRQVTPFFLLVIFFLMGVAPLAAWRRQTTQRLGRAVVVPALLAALIVAALVARGTSHPGALVGYGLLAFAGLATLAEIWKGVSARARREQQPGQLLLIVTGVCVMLMGQYVGYWTLAHFPAVVTMIIDVVSFLVGFGVVLFGLWRGGYVYEFTRLIARDRRRYGGYFIHLGMVILGLGVIGSTSFQQIRQETLAVGERMQIGEYVLQHDGLYSAIADDGRQMIIAHMTVYKDGAVVDHIQPRRDTFFTVDRSGKMIATADIRIPGTYSTLANDVYTVIIFWEGNRVTFRAYLNPLINFVWLGGFVLIAGTLVGLWPSRSVPAARTVSAPAGAGNFPAGTRR